jgi:2-oxoglutarate ferredoxin oxidoreductase subunit alpha
MVDVMRVGPGLGNIQPSQGDYNQLVKFGGHGDFKVICLAPSTVQESVDLMALAFDLAEKYRTLVYLVSDGALGQMMEPAELPPMRPVNKQRPAWALTGADHRPANVITSIFLDPDQMEKLNLRLQAKLNEIRKNEVRWKELMTEDAELLLVAYGTMGRVCYTAMKQARAEGIKVGLLRPITLWPYPSARVAELAEQVQSILTVEMSAGQMVEDVRLAVEGRCPVQFYGRMGGIVPLPDEVLKVIHEMNEELVMARPGELVTA